ncbi:MAG: hypothetical protein C5B58_07325 [Acidobacteria bacterium]|nr:MAG: hypothetical protein C5B58_07325 [Acidobacteriota bacterium]
MARLPSELPLYLRQTFGISRRTFERWCARGDVPGAYRTRGGHWRVRKPAWATIENSKPLSETRRDRVLCAIIAYPYFYIPDEERTAAFNLTLAGREIADRDVFNPDLEERFPEKYRFLWGPRERMPRWVWKAVNQPQRAPAIAAANIRRNGGEVTTPSDLARVLGVSVATLYRRYGKREIRRICETPIRGSRLSELD